MLAFSSTISKDLKSTEDLEKNYIGSNITTSNSLSSTETKVLPSELNPSSFSDRYHTTSRDCSTEYDQPKYYNINTSHYHNKPFFKKSPHNAFDRPHWRKKQGTGSFPKNNNFDFQKLDPTEINKRPNKVGAYTGTIRFNKRQNNSDENLFFSEEIDDNNYLESNINFESSLCNQNNNLELSVSQAESYHIPGYVNQENLPFPVGYIINDPKSKIDYKLLNVLGEGSYAVVYLARNLADRSLRALKCLSSHNLTCSQKELQQLEIDLHKYVSGSPYIVNLHYSFTCQDWTFLVLELVTGSDLYEYIMQNSNFGAADKKSHHITEAIRLFEQMLEAISHLHSLRVYHRDLKPENFIVDANGNLKLTDFGLSTRESVSTEFECGSKPYMSYENRNGGINYEDTTIFGYNDGYSPRLSDVWALGVLLLNLLYAECPWQDPSIDSCFRFCNFLRDGSRYLQNNFSNLPKEVADFLVSNVFCPEPKRCSVLDLKLWVSDLKSAFRISTNLKSYRPSPIGAISIPHDAKNKQHPTLHKIQNNFNKKENRKSRELQHANVIRGNVSIISSSNSTVSSSVPANMYTSFVSKAKAAAANHAMPREKYVVAAKNVAANLHAQHKNEYGPIPVSNNTYCPKSKYFRQQPKPQQYYSSNKPVVDEQLSSSCLPNIYKIPFNNSKNFFEYKKTKELTNAYLSKQSAPKSYKNYTFEMNSKTSASISAINSGNNNFANRSPHKYNKNNSVGRNTLDFYFKGSSDCDIDPSSVELKNYSNSFQHSNLLPTIQTTTPKSFLGKNPVYSSFKNNNIVKKNQTSTSFNSRNISLKNSDLSLSTNSDSSLDLLWSDNNEPQSPKINNFAQAKTISHYELDVISSRVDSVNINAPNKLYSNFDGYLSDIFEIE
ncbi:hypothetical protein BB561_000775 [Smittium simulii]|uniref:non-specific serine/threonine protein kinase n=1 Tax=Smittium simulii TaxID=133385 RepID=A0A2T9YXJ1_9FUNG|nr:hypothetical protein BB561_000775 [Smittium simulii]